MPSHSLMTILCCTLISWIGSATDALGEGPERTGNNESAERAAIREAYINAGYEPSSINMGAVMSDEATKADEIVLSDGDVIRGRILEENADEVILMHPVFEQMRIPREKILAVKRGAPRPPRPGFGEVVTGAGVRPQTSSRQQVAPQNQTSDEETTEGTTAPEKADPRTAEALLDFDHWNFVVGAAFGFVENVNSEFNIRLSAQAEHNSEFARLRINGAYFLNSANSVLYYFFIFHSLSKTNINCYFCYCWYFH